MSPAFSQINADKRGQEKTSPPSTQGTQRPRTEKKGVRVEARKPRRQREQPAHHEGTKTRRRHHDRRAGHRPVADLPLITYHVPRPASGPPPVPRDKFVRCFPNVPQRTQRPRTQTCLSGWKPGGQEQHECTEKRHGPGLFNRKSQMRQSQIWRRPRRLPLTTYHIARTTAAWPCRRGTA
jgi:hypothetical protein